MTESLLSVRGLVKRYGAIAASDGVDLEIPEGEVHALIGPNGAGKSTLIDQLAGETRPDAGSVLLRGTDITALDTPARARLGIARSFQVSSLFGAMSALDNARLALLGAKPHCFTFWRPVRRDRALTEAAHALLDEAGLAERAGVLASALAHGERRQLEYALALARAPALVLLDEPMAGMGVEDSARMVRLLQSHRGRHAMLLVEHDMDAVFALADRITVLVYGRVIASGAPAAVRADRAVQRAYLGGAA